MSLIETLNSYAAEPEDVPALPQEAYPPEDQEPLQMSKEMGVSLVSDDCKLTSVLDLSQYIFDREESCDLYVRAMTFMLFNDLTSFADLMAKYDEMSAFIEPGGIYSRLNISH
jgi:hypothetical protein